MSMSATDRRRFTLHSEGLILNYSGSTTPEYAAEYARCMADGAFNALIRLEGPEGAARFAFALGDRVAGGIREPTNYLATLLQKPEEPEAASVEQAIESLNETLAEIVVSVTRDIGIEKQPPAPPPCRLIRLFTWLQVRGWLS